MKDRQQLEVGKVENVTMSPIILGTVIIDQTYILTALSFHFFVAIFFTMFLA
jgi:hypothetical protein